MVWTEITGKHYDRSFVKYSSAEIFKWL